MYVISLFYVYQLPFVILIYYRLKCLLEYFALVIMILKPTLEMPEQAQ